MQVYVSFWQENRKILLPLALYFKIYQMVEILEKGVGTYHSPEYEQSGQSLHCFVYLF